MSSQAALGAEIGGYRLEALIGQGGMSAVYKAVEIASRRACALKLMRAELAGDAAFRERFVREGSYGASVVHDHIVRVLAAGETGGSLYLVMDYVEGTDLRRVIDSERRLDPARAIRILGEIGSALDAVHAAGMVHRDVKPANILLDARRNEFAYLADFGLTKNPSADAVALTAAGTFVGTIDYCAPEQILPQEIEVRAHSVDPSPLVVREEGQGAELGGASGGLRRAAPILGVEQVGGLGELRARLVEVDDRAQRQPEAQPALLGDQGLGRVEPGALQEPPHVGEHAAQRGVLGLRQQLGPQRVGELVAADGSLVLRSQIGEDELGPPTRQPGGRPRDP